MRRDGQGTRYPGVKRVGPQEYLVVAKTRDPRTGKVRRIERLVSAATERAAAAKRAEMLEEVRSAVGLIERPRVGDFAKRWLASKALKVERGTAERYSDALERALVHFGDFYFDALRSSDVQEWIDAELRADYSVHTVRGWFRTVRTMVRDALDPLGLTRDPTLRISFPEAPEPEANALTAAQLADFLTAMRVKYPQHLALTAVLAWTGLRFCHASALQWGDVDEEAGVLRIQRKQIRGRVGPVSRKKRAPKVIPLEPELLAVLREHRARLASVTPWCFPSSEGTLRTPGSLWKAWRGCLTAAGIAERFTVHGLRRTFTDLGRRAGADPAVIKALTGHVTEAMREHYSTIGLDERRATMAKVIQMTRGGAA